MREYLALALFAGLLVASVAGAFPLVAALVMGYGVFFGYGLTRGHTPGDLLSMSIQGINTVKTILFLFLLIGMTTALWRACGTIPVLIDSAAGLLSPALFPLLAFLLNAGISFLTGTSFGTAATMGTICMTMANAMGLPPVLSAGAILSGAFFGDRCSPMSTSAFLVAALTETDLYRNLRAMVKTAAVPLAATCLVYLAAGLLWGRGIVDGGVLPPFAQGFRLHWLAVLPAAAILILSLFRCPVKVTMGVSILLGAGLAFGLQGLGVGEILRLAVLGYEPSLPALRPILSGGGVVSMLTPFCIVCISSTFSGLFSGTGLLDGLKEMTHRLARRGTPFGSLLLVSVVTSMIACNQTLAIMLSHALCRGEFSNEDLAVGLENTAVVVAPLVPWSIAGAVPLATLGAPAAALLGACYLYFIPIWNWIIGRFAPPTAG